MSLGGSSVGLHKFKQIFENKKFGLFSLLTEKKLLSSKKFPVQQNSFDTIVLDTQSKYNTR